MKRYILFLTFLIAIVLPMPAHAYAGPGVAIAAIVIFGTVIASFFASIILKVYKITKKLFKSFMQLLKKQFSKKKKSKIYSNKTR